MAANTIFKGILASATLLLAMPSQAAQQGVQFGITVGVRHYCQIVLTQEGTLAASPDLTELSSKQAGGANATAELTTTNGSFRVTLDAPTTFTTMPTDGNTGVSFATSYSMTGATTVVETPGTTSTKVKRGLSNINMDLVATRSAGTFPAGNYGGIAVLRCE